MYCLELIKFYVSNNTYSVEVENGALLQDIVRSWKMVLGGHGKSWKIFMEKGGNPAMMCWSVVCLCLSICISLIEVCNCGRQRHRCCWISWTRSQSIVTR